MKSMTNFKQELQNFYQLEQLEQKEKYDCGYAEELLNTMENGLKILFYPSKRREWLQRVHPIPFDSEQTKKNLKFVYCLHCWDLLQLYHIELPEELHIGMMVQLEQCQLKEDYKHFYEMMQTIFQTQKQQQLQKEMVKK